MINENMEIAITSAGMAGVAGLILGMILGQAFKSETKVATSKFNPYMVQWDTEFVNGKVLYRGLYEDDDYQYTVTDVTREAVINSLKDMVNS